MLAVVHGEGGSGKSTVLRRLAYERYQCALEQGKQEVCWWVTDLDLFLTHDAVSIQEKPQQTHLLLVEDWYRNVGNAKAKVFFEWLKNQPHVAVVVGDRNPSGRAYMDQLYGLHTIGSAAGHEALFALTPQENQTTLSFVLQQLQTLQQPGAQALQTLMDNHSPLLSQAPLFMALYVLCHEAAQSSPQLDLRDGVQTNFAQIVSKQLRKLEAAESTRGLGRALLVQAAIYTAPESAWQSFSETTLQNTAQFFAAESSMQRHLNFFNSGNYPTALATLVHRSAQYIKGNWVRFNHDLIAEVGIQPNLLTSQEADAPAVLRADFSEVLDTNTLFDLYTYQLTKEDAYGALQLFCYLAHQQFFDRHVAHQCRLDLVDLFVKQGLHLNIRALLQTCNDAASKREFSKAFLSDLKRIVGLSSAASVVMRLLQNDPAGRAAARDVLGQTEFWKLPHQIISTALNILGANDEGAKKAARDVLGYTEFWKLPYQIISTALNTLGANDEDAKTAARDVLRHTEFWKLSKEIISTALNILGANDEDAKKAARDVLGHTEFWKLPDSIIKTALNILDAGDAVAQNAASQILSSSGSAQQLGSFVAFAAIKVLAKTTDANAKQVLQNYLDALYIKTNPSKGEIKLRYDLLFQPLFFNPHFLKLWKWQAKAYGSNANYHTIKNIYKILQCQYQYGEQIAEVEYITQRLCQIISKYCADDVRQQWRTHPHELSLMHISLAFEVMNPSQSRWKLAAIEKNQSLGAARSEIGR